MIRVSFRLCLCALFSFSINSVIAQTAPVTTDWAAAARQDIQFAADSIRTRHAGAVVGQINVLEPLEAGMRVGLAEADTVKTQQDYRRALARFIDGFGDPHTGIYMQLKPHGWTGIVLDHVLDGAVDQYRVTWSEPNWPTPLPPSGAIVRSCDGVWIGTYLQIEVAPFVNHGAEYPTSSGEFARKSMFDIGLGWTPKRCDFTLASGQRQTFDLPLQAVPETVTQERIAEVQKRYVASAKPVGLYALAADKSWVGMPNFDGAASAHAYEKLYKELAKLDKSTWLIFDLRGNGGGDSSWGNRALQALYGKELGKKLDTVAAYAEYMIADQSDIDMFRKLASAPEYAASKDEFEEIVKKLEQATAAGNKMAQLEGVTPAEAEALAAQVRHRPRGESLSHHKPRLAAIIDRNCFSSCMNFLLQIEAFSDTVVLGEPTIGYSPFGELNYVKLPSGNATVQIPSAVFSAFQAPREPFLPTIRYTGNMADDDALMKWVNATLSSIKADRNTIAAARQPLQ